MVLRSVSVPRRAAPSPCTLACAAALWALHWGANAQTTLAPVTVTGGGTPPAEVSGWGAVPPSKAPFQASVYPLEPLRDRGVQRLSDLTRLDPAVSDAYNTEGYWDFVTVRGYTLDNRFNYRRDGLPINAETSIPLDNKERIEVLKGTSGLQAGTSAPGGLVNLVVKRPLAEPLRSARIEWQEQGSLLGAVDVSQRLGTDQAFGLRLNAAAQRLEPQVRNAKGERRLLAVAGDWKVSPTTRLDAEFETSHRRQPSVPGFSLLGATLPPPGDPRINLNNQPWSKPVVMDADTASLRLQQQLGPGWTLTLHGGVQHLHTDDRLAYPFGCSAEGDYTRYCLDGSFDVYAFQSENERRRTRSLSATLDGQAQWGGLEHLLSLQVLRTRFEARFEPRLDDFFTIVGQGTVDGSTVVPTPTGLGTVPNTDRTERSTELALRDRIALNDTVGLWLGVRHTRLERSSVGTDGSEPTAATQSFTTPWLATTVALDATTTAYASWGQGVESDIAPNRASYTNRGQALAALKRRQLELGLKRDGDAFDWNVTLFDIARPVAGDVGSDCASGLPDGCTRQVDGEARHRGVEASSNWRAGPWALQGGVQWLHARREGSVRADINGKRPTTVPTTTLKLQARYGVSAVPGLALLAGLHAESGRMVLEDNSVRIPGHGQLDVGLRYLQRPAGGTTLVWRAGIDNLFDRRAWRESPFQFEHAYLFPLAPRTARLSLQADF